MKQCKDCKYAEWAKTKAGKLHPTGAGRCTYDVTLPAIPQAFYFVTKPLIGGGYIFRNEELKDHCVYYARP